MGSCVGVSVHVPSDRVLPYLYYRKPCRVKYKFTKSGEKVRVSRRTGTVIPKSPELRERRDFKSRSGYVGEENTHFSSHIHST